jgi:K+-transporting ATPase ATPase C chain
MLRQLNLAIKACAVTFIVCAVGYPALVWCLAQLLLPAQSEGSLIYGADGTTIKGSELVAQGFQTERYFHPRPSFVDYKADAAGGSNLGTNNPELRRAIAGRAAALGATAEHPAPLEMVMASGSGLDPDISPDAAIYQAARVARARGLTVEKVRAMIAQATNRSGTILGAPPRVNVLLLNLALDAEPDAGTR